MGSCHSRNKSQLEVVDNHNINNSNKPSMLFVVLIIVDNNGGNKYRIDPQNPKSTDNIDTSNDLLDESTVNLFGEDSDSDNDNLRGVSNVVYRKE